ncbi:MAG: hypothetical protein J7K88_08005, partial [Candidatus Fermentibacteraceae bacterium]|nr:hypothetical protein [Candidatus Fermentibacteraceae bacterium]
MKTVTMLVLLISAAVFATGITAQLPSELVEDYTLQTISTGVVPHLQGAYPGTEQGLPSLPELPWTLPLPSGERAVSLESTAVWETVAGGVSISPLPAPLPLILEAEASAVTGRDEIYTADSFWPSEPVRLSGTGFIGGLPQAEMLVTPLRWNPATGELQKLVSLEIHIETAPLGERPFCSAGRDDEITRMLIVTEASLETTF